MGNELVVLNAEQFGVDKSEAQEIENIFVPMVEILKGFEKEYNEIVSQKEMTPEIAKRAKRCRLDIAQVRIETDKHRLKGNENSQREIKARNGVAHILKFAVVEKEDVLKKIESHFEVIEQERKQKLAEDRAKELEEYETYNVSVLAEMDEDVYKNFIAGAKFNHDTKIEADLNKGDSNKFKDLLKLTRRCIRMCMR